MRRLSSDSRQILGVAFAAGLGVLVLSALCVIVLDREISKSTGRVDVRALRQARTLALVAGPSAQIIPIGILIWVLFSTYRRDITRTVKHLAQIIRNCKRELFIALAISVTLAMLTVIAIPLVEAAAKNKMVTIDYDERAANGLRIAVRGLVTKIGLVAQLVPLGVVVYGLYRAYRETRRRGFCRYCGYNLKGNVSGVCPECGTPTGRRGKTP